MRAIGILWVNESLVLGLFRLFGRDGMDALQLARGADESAKIFGQPHTGSVNQT